MTEQIKDGTGNSYLAKIDNENRLWTFSVTEPLLSHISFKDGLSYYLASDFVSLTTTGSANGVFYLKYTGTKNLAIASIRTCGTATQQWRCLKSATTGTLISDANAGDNNNVNLSSANTLSADVYGASGDAKTVTNGTQMAQWINNTGHSETAIDGALILSQNDTIALTCEIVLLRQCVLQY